MPTNSASFNGSTMVSVTEHSTSSENSARLPVIYPALASRSLASKFRALDAPEFICDVCGSILLSKSGITAHMYLHFSDGEYPCLECPKTQLFTHSKLYKRHVKEKHGSGLSFQCKHCQKKFKTRSRLESHSISHSDIRAYSCVHCDKTYKRDHILRKHLYDAHNLDLTVRRRTYGINPSSFTCDICDATYKKRYKFERHILLHYSDGEFLCEFCRRVFENSKLFERHKLICPPNPQTHPYKCESCNLTFIFKSRYDSHKVTHSADRNFPCTQCDLRFKRARGLRVHMKGVHMKNKEPESKTPLIVRRVDNCSDGEFPCVLCNKVFLHSELFERHQSTFHDIRIAKPVNAPFIPQEKRFKCAYCDAAFPHKCRLRYHMVKHVKNKNFICAICEGRFKSKECIRKHLVNHRKKRYVLSILCDENFNQILDKQVQVINEYDTPKNVVTTVAARF